MTHVKTLNKANLKESCAKGGCGECQASCLSACKTSCTVANLNAVTVKGQFLSLNFCPQKNIRRSK